VVLEAGGIVTAPLAAPVVPGPSVVMVGTMVLVVSSRIFGRRSLVCSFYGVVECLVRGTMSMPMLGVGAGVDVKVGGSSSRLVSMSMLMPMALRLGSMPVSMLKLVALRLVLLSDYKSRLVMVE